MTNPVSVDGGLEIERARRRFASAITDSVNGRLHRPYGDPDLRFNELRTAILKHDPVVRGLLTALYEIEGASEMDTDSQYGIWKTASEAIKAFREAIGEGDQG